MNSHSRSFACPRAVAVGVVACVGLLLLAQPARAQPAKVKEKEKEAQVLRLKNASAVQAARILQELFGETVGAKGRIRIAADEASNSLVVMGDALDLLTVAKLLQQIDVPDAERPKEPEHVLEVIELRHLRPDKRIVEALQMVLPPPSRVTVLSESKVLLFGPPTAINRARDLLARLEEARPDRPAALHLQVRLFWLVSTPDEEKAGELPVALRDLAGPLESLGVTRPKLVAQLAAAVTPGVPFEISGQVKLEATHRVTALGTLADAREGANLDVQIAVAGQAAKAADGGGFGGGRGPRVAGDVGGLRTQLSVTGARPVVLGVLPLDGRASAFVALVTATPAAGKPADKPAAKKVTIEFKNKPWAAVFEWLADQTGIPVIARDRPTGAFTFVPPQEGGRPRQYTLNEVFDILNEALMAQNYILIRRPTSFTLVPADEKIDPALVPRVVRADLPDLPRTQLVSVVMSLRATEAENIAPEARKLLGPFGQAVALRNNLLILTDTAANLQRICDVLEKVDGGK